MLEIEKWVKGKNPLISGHALKIAFVAEEAYLLSVDAREKTLVSSKIKTPDLKTWLSLYKSSSKVMSAVQKPSRNAGGFHELDLWMYDGISETIKGIRRDKEGVMIAIKNMSSDELTTIERFVRIFIKKWQKGLIRDIKNEINNVPDPSFDKAAEGMDKSPEVAFFLKVTLPCWFTYAQHPSKLLQLAQRGDTAALDKLLRIDPSIVFDSKISERFHRAVHSTKRSEYADYIDPLRREPKTYNHRRKAKMRIAGIISYISGGLGQKLNEPEIRDLFDAISKDLGHGDTDEDIPQDPHLFARYIRHQAKTLKTSLVKDKF